VIAYIKSLGIPPRRFPTTGQDATLIGLQNVLSGYQCGSVYKPIYLEAQAAAALALYVRANVSPPMALLNETTTDTVERKQVPSVLLAPIWVTPANMASTVIKDRFAEPQQLCAGHLAAACRAAGISG
jgi:D-xylose transport system substrate-binding protein